MSFKDKKIFDSIEQTIGNTPLVKLKNIKSKLGFYGEIMAKLGFRTIDEMVGKVEKLDRNTAIEHYKSRGIDLISRYKNNDRRATEGTSIFNRQIRNRKTN